MTERKPPGVSFESFVDKQIREAAERGDFKTLAGFGKPLPNDSAPYDELWWIKGKMHREGHGVLPPALALRKEAEDAVAAVADAKTEFQVRRLLGEVNKKIEAAVRRPPPGPPLGLEPFDIPAELECWRERRAAQAD
ncbi:DUF1992 domain-containing protein [Streptomyces sp. NPDC001941]|uniref:DnaJ family domain-containing protein n=1 Tax=Streptomyces sp. NPDC001941 TaxID=3154659 RepID=UPI003320EF43